LRKETGTENLILLGELLDELLVLVQDRNFMLGCTLLEQLVCMLILQLRAMSSGCIAGSDSKRDLLSINQILDLLIATAEKIHILSISCDTSIGKCCRDTLISGVRKHIHQSWSKSSRLRWQRLEKKDSYWNENECEKALSTSIHPFLDACQMVLFICEDVAEAVHAVQEETNERGFMFDKLLELTVQLLPSLHENFEFSRYNSLHTLLLLRSQI
jgi:hypothetical protein